jgi:predicted ester cyclase
MTLDPHRALIERWFHELFTLPHSTVLDQLVTDDFVTRDPSGKIGAPNPAAFQTWLQWYRTSFTDATWEIQDLLSVGNKVVVRYAGQTTYRGGLFQIPAKNQRVTEMGILIFHIRENRICELWAALSDLELVLEMGAIPTVPVNTA